MTIDNDHPSLLAEILVHRNLSDLIPSQDVTLRNTVGAYIDDVNRTRSLNMAHDLQCLVDGVEVARAHLDEVYPLPDGETVKSLRFWTAADLIALADLRAMLSGFFNHPKDADLRQSAGTLIEVAARLNDDDASTIGDVDWFGDRS